MDNKQDKQFYWEVKDFLNRKPAVQQTKVKTQSLKESIQRVTEMSNNLYTEKPSSVDSNKEIANELSCFSNNLMKNVNSLLSLNEEAVSKSTPECKAFTANNVHNMFNLKKNLNEAILTPEIGVGRKTPQYRKEIESDSNQSIFNRANEIQREFQAGMQLAGNTVVKPETYSGFDSPNLVPGPVRILGGTPEPVAILSGDQQEMLKNLRTGRSISVPSYNPKDPGSLAAARSGRAMRNQAIADANIALRGEIESLKGQLKDKSLSPDEQRNLRDQIRKLNYEMNPGTPQMGNATQGSIGSRYYSSNVKSAPKKEIKLETMKEILSGSAVNKKPVPMSLDQMKRQVPR